MASNDSAQAVEHIIDYTLRHGFENMRKALTAAGAVEEEWDGNRKLAQFGTALSEFLLNYLAFEAGVTRACANDFRKRVTSNEHRASIARQTGINAHIRFNEQEGAQSSSVLAKAVNAIIAVVFFDCGEDISVVLRVMRHIGIFTPAGQSVNPTLLSLDDLPNSLDVGSLARSLFTVEMSSHSLSITAGDDHDRIPLTCCSTPQHASTDVQQAAAKTDVSKEVENNGQLSPIRQDLSSNSGETNVEAVAAQLSRDSTQIVSPIVADREAATTCDTAGVVHQGRRPAGKRVSGLRAESRHRKKLRGCEILPQVDVIGTYLTKEEQKCRDFGHQIPQDTFLTPPIQQAIQDLGEGKTEVLAKILIYIGSPCLVGGLQDILGSCESQESCMTVEATSSLSRAERIHLIASLGHNISRFQLLRRHHILQLFKECGGSGALTCVMVTTPFDLTHPSNKSGNPANRSVANITEKMMQETFPNIDFGTSEYRTKYRWISDMRRLGRRLHMLETRFGEGVLGLMLDQGLAGTDVGITDKMIMTPTDSEYAKFVDILDRSQGDLLRGLSMAVSPTVQALTFGGVQGRRVFDIEKVTLGDIVKYPKGSSAFLELILKVP